MRSRESLRLGSAFSSTWRRSVIRHGRREGGGVASGANGGGGFDRLFASHLLDLELRVGNVRSRLLDEVGQVDRVGGVRLQNVDEPLASLG